MNIKDFSNSLDYLVEAELTPFIWGHSGIGKSSIVKQYAAKKGFKFFPFYLGTQSDIGDILGLADFVRDASGTVVATKFAMPEWLKGMIDYCNANPDSGAIIFLDEFNRARKDILNGMFSLALDKTFHTLVLPKNCHVIAAGNPPTEEYHVTDIQETALMARFVHVKLEPTLNEWVDYAESTGIDHTLIGFIKDQPQLLESKKTDFELPVKVDRRSYERLNRLFKSNTPKYLVDGLMPGIIGIERTVAYAEYLKSNEKPLDGEAVLKIQDDPSILSKVKNWTNPANICTSILNCTYDNLAKYLTARNKKKEFLTDGEKGSLMYFLDITPKDIAYPMIKSLTQSDNKLFANFHTDLKYQDKLMQYVRDAKGMKE